MVMMVQVELKKTSSAEITSLSVRSSGAVVLPSGLHVEETEHKWDDVRWSHRPQLSPEKNGTTQSWDHRQFILVVSLKRNMTTCEHRRCELLSNGSLRFSRVQTEDSGIYSLEVFYENGTMRIKTDVRLTVEENPTDVQSDNTSVFIYCLPIFFLLLLFFIILFVLRWRRNGEKKISGPSEENVYVSMRGRRGNTRNDEDKQKRQTEEEPTYVDVGGGRSVYGTQPNRDDLVVSVLGLTWTSDSPLSPDCSNRSFLLVCYRLHITDCECHC
ncbi:hypothetical protein Q5P01_008345 [Channa striata]|uniref:Immunoglobulin V-set domain-containing protein n=1 Tax=Channa striata TaxID=64152 RepID=A0AA88SUN3_CHASR|nr:hypothetical protein Q5P01_008345 [Channa striata]